MTSIPKKKKKGQYWSYSTEDKEISCELIGNSKTVPVLKTSVKLEPTKEEKPGDQYSALLLLRLI